MATFNEMMAVAAKKTLDLSYRVRNIGESAKEELRQSAAELERRVDPRRKSLSTKTRKEIDCIDAAISQYDVLLDKTRALSAEDRKNIETRRQQAINKRGTAQ